MQDKTRCEVCACAVSVKYDKAILQFLYQDCILSRKWLEIMIGVFVLLMSRF